MKNEKEQESMTERIHNITRAICRQADGSRADGEKITHLPFAVMSPDVNLASVDHSEVASDTDRLAARLFLTNYCKTLSRALMCDYDFHTVEIIKSESKELPIIEYSIRFGKNRTPIQNGINVLLYKKHESLPSLDLNHNHEYKCMNIF